MLVATTYQKTFLACHAQVASIDVGRHVNAGEVADVHRAVCVGQSGGDESTFEFGHIVKFVV
jgi:hypothetical protein